MRLLILLACPPTTSGQRTLSRLATLTKVIPGCTVSAANLCSARAADLPALSAVAASVEPWLHARKDISAALSKCDEMMAAWGICPLSGTARQHRVAQLSWLLNTAINCGRSDVLAVGGQARHPSRWHQYVSDVHGRTCGGTFEERLRQVLIKVPLNTLVR